MARDAHLRAQLFRKDGTLVGVTFSLNKPKPRYCYPRLLVSLDITKTKPYHRHLQIKDNFYSQYSMVVENIAEYRGISKRSRIYHEMEASVTQFMARYNLNVKVETRTIQLHHLSHGKQKFFKE